MPASRSGWWVAIPGQPHYDGPGRAHLHEGRAAVQPRAFLHYPGAGRDGETEFPIS